MAEIINLNDASPAAPAGYINGKWQKGPQSGVDPTSGYGVFPVSVYVPLGGGLNPMQETPTGVGTATLTLTQYPIAMTLILVVNGVIQMPGIDYTISGLVVTMTVSTLSTDKLGAWYSY